MQTTYNQELEDLFQDMVTFLESNDSEYGNLHWFVGKDGEATDQMWYEDSKGDAYDLPARFNPLIEAGYIN